MSSSRWVGTDTYSDPFHRPAPNRLDFVDDEPFSSDRRWIKTERPLKPVLIRRQRRSATWPPPSRDHETRRHDARHNETGDLATSAGVTGGVVADPDRRTGSRAAN